MSYIDCYDHEYIGHLGYLPIYRPLETIEGDKWGGYDFSAHPGNLILGGGSGEHPALIIHKLECLVAKFLYGQLTVEEEQQLSKEEQDYLLDLCYADDILEFCGWSINHYASLRDMAKSPALMRPLGDDEQVEEWLCQSLGELIFFSLGELNPQHEKLSKIFSPFTIETTMCNIACIPPGYPPCGGRKVVNGKLQWGLYRWNATSD